ncbi:hypothetical protein BDQ17DRAFT_1436410 [Cyathus striatus]|nr:hypothetical protein BDQ17DRAFT_1436410 [Cyathus striatus]
MLSFETASAFLAASNKLCFVTNDMLTALSDASCNIGEEILTELADATPHIIHPPPLLNCLNDAMEPPYREAVFTLRKVYNQLEKCRIPFSRDNYEVVQSACKVIHMIHEAQATAVITIPDEPAPVPPVAPATPVSSAATMVKRKRGTHGKGPAIVNTDTDVEMPGLESIVSTGTAPVPGPTASTAESMFVDDAVATVIPVVASPATPAASTQAESSAHPETVVLPYSALQGLDHASSSYRRYESLSFRKCAKPEPAMPKSPYGVVAWAHGIADHANSMWTSGQMVTYQDHMALHCLNSMMDAANQAEWSWI